MFSSPRRYGLTTQPGLGLYYHKVEDDLPNSFQLPMIRKVWDVGVPMGMRRWVHPNVVLRYKLSHYNLRLKERN